MNTIVSFDYDIFELDKDNAREKIIPYINELLDSLVSNKCRNIKIITKIKLLSNKEVEVYFTAKEIDDIINKKKK